ncbi:MAG: MATE family efflux transporter [Fimbriimonas sp.]
MAQLADPPSSTEIPSENPTRVVWALAWPAVALNSLQVVNTLLDRGFIGHLEEAALTAHGGSMNVMFLMFSLAVALATGSTALVSRNFGAGERALYRLASRQAMGLAVIGGVIICGVTVLIAPWAARAVLPPENVDAIRLMTRFAQIYALGLPAIFVIQTLAGSLRGIGDTRSPMVISGMQILLHILLNFLLIFPTRKMGGIEIPGAGWGLPGAAAALSISAWASAVGYVAFAGKTPLGIQWRIRIPRPDWTTRILRIAVPAATMAVLRVFSLTAFTIALKLVPNGSAAIAAMGIAFAIESIMFMPAFGLSAAAGALVGQSLGMKRPDRAERLGWIAAHHAALVTIALAGPIFIAAPAIAFKLLDGKTLIESEAVTVLRYLCATEFLFGYSMVLIGAMQGAGDTRRPMWISIVSLWGLRVPLAFFLALKTGQPLGLGLTMPFGMGLGTNGAWLALAFTQGIQGLMSIIAYKQGAWKHAKV